MYTLYKPPYFQFLLRFYFAGGVLLVALASSRVEQRSQLLKFTSFLVHVFGELL